MSVLPLFIVVANWVFDRTLDLILSGRQRRLAPTRRTTFPDELRNRIAKQQRYVCRYCGTRLTDSNMDIDHKDPIDRQGSNASSNLQALCRACNTRKNLQSDAEFRRRYRSILPPRLPPLKQIPQARFREETRLTMADTAVRKHRRTKYRTPTQRILAAVPTVSIGGGLVALLAGALAGLAGELLLWAAGLGAAASLLFMAGVWRRAVTTGRTEER